MFRLGRVGQTTNSTCVACQRYIYSNQVLREQLSVSPVFPHGTTPLLRRLSQQLCHYCFSGRLGPKRSLHDQEVCFNVTDVTVFFNSPSITKSKKGLSSVPRPMRFPGILRVFDILHGIRQNRGSSRAEAIHHVTPTTTDLELCAHLLCTRYVTLKIKPRRRMSARNGIYNVGILVVYTRNGDCCMGGD